jgi:hypothetical protein
MVGQGRWWAKPEWSAEANVPNGSTSEHPIANWLGESRLGATALFRIHSTLIPRTRDGEPPCKSLSLACLRHAPYRTHCRNQTHGLRVGLPGLFIIRGVLAVKACARAKRPCSQVASRALTAALRRVFPLHRQSAGMEAGEHHA